MFEALLTEIDKKNLVLVQKETSKKEAKIYLGRPFFNLKQVWNWSYSVCDDCRLILIW